MKNTISLIIILLSFSINAQTEAELIGKWKLVKWTQNGKEKNLQDHFHTDQVFQVFLEKKTPVSKSYRRRCSQGEMEIICRRKKPHNHRGHSANCIFH